MKPATSILVTDDEPNIRLTLRRALEPEGYAVQEAAEGRDALEAIGRHAPDLMILDLNMPGLDGMAVLERLKPMDATHKPRVIVLTAHGSVPVAVKAIRLGARDFLEKPVTPAALRECVAAVLDEPAGDGVPAPGPEPVLEQFRRSYARTLDQVRGFLKDGKFENAELLLSKVEDVSTKDAAYLNLLGIVYEAQKKWRLARKFYGRAMIADRNYVPAQKNMRRIYELTTFGKTQERVSL